MEASTAIRSRLIGAIFVEKNLITSEQLERALKLQEDTGDLLGEILVAQFGVARLELASVLAEQWSALEKPERALAAEHDRPAQTIERLAPAEVQIRRPIGEIFVELGFVSSDQLDVALDAQRETSAPLGEILVEQGSLSRLDLASALAEQWSALQKLRPPAPAADRQLWQSGLPVASPPAQGWSVNDGAVVAELDERLRVVEQAAGATPWQEDLRLVTSDFRAALSAVEARIETSGRGAANAELAVVLEALSARIEALESTSVSTELDLLRQGLEEVSARPANVEGLTELRAQMERLEARPDSADEVANLTTEVTILATRLDEIGEIDEMAEMAELTERLEVIAGQTEVAQRGITGLICRVDGFAEIESRIDEVAVRLPGEGVIDELKRALAELATQSANDDQAIQRAEVASLVARLDRLAARVEDVAAASVPDVTPRIDELAGRIEEVAGATPVAETHDLATRLEGLDVVRVSDALATGARFAGLEARLEAFAARLQHRPEDDALAGVVADLEAEIEALSRRFDDVVGAIRTDWKARCDEILSQCAAQSNETAVLHARLEELRETDSGLTSSEARLESVLEQRLDGLASRMTDEVSGARADAEQVTATVRGEMGSLGRRIDGLVHLRQTDTHATRAASERLDDDARRSAEAAFQFELALREELGSIAARLEERDAQGIEAREELRDELEHVASSVGWRLERIEESLASDDSVELKAAVADLERRLERQVALGEEQVRVTERALRKGLAALGERLVDSESAYVAAGNTLRRSIERLGAAVVEADARMADQIPLSGADGCVAFAPTAAGYRLVELPDTPPEVGSTIELEGCDGPLLVTRYGRSPLPLDSRPCAYLDHV